MSEKEFDYIDTVADRATDLILVRSVLQPTA